LQQLLIEHEHLLTEPLSILTNTRQGIGGTSNWGSTR